MTNLVKIDSLAYGGSGVGRIEIDGDSIEVEGDGGDGGNNDGGKNGGDGRGKVVFVPFSHPGDELSVRVTEEKKSFVEAGIVEIIKPSADRVEPVCEVFGRCGGCSFQHINYSNQLLWKRKMFEETIRRIGKIDIPLIEDSVPSDSAYGYRIRAAFHVDGSKWGFYASSSNDVVDFTSCPLLDDRLNSVFSDIKARLSGKKTALIGLEMGVSEADGSVSAIFNVSASDGFDWHTALSPVEGLKGYEVRLTTKGGGRRKGRGASGRRRGPILREGSTRIGYSLPDFSLKLSADIGVFTQVNWSGNRSLVRKAIEYADLKGGERILDLYSGVGNFSLPFAGSVGPDGEVTAVEGEALSVKIARGNARMAGVKNITFAASGVGEWLKSSEGKKIASPPPDVVLLDPPRKGAKEVLKAVAALKPGRIIYISCSPPSLARDMALLALAGYTPRRASVVDVFPQTYHIETIVEFRRA